MATYMESSDIFTYPKGCNETLYVEHYSLKYSYDAERQVVRVTIPSHSVEIPLIEDDDITTKVLPEEFKNVLRGLGWRKIAILVLERGILFPEDKKWVGMLKIKRKTGIVKPVSTNGITSEKLAKVAAHLAQDQ